jgi:hypothetical protein
MRAAVNNQVRFSVTVQTVSISRHSGEPRSSIQAMGLEGTPDTSKSPDISRGCCWSAPSGRVRFRAMINSQSVARPQEAAETG